MLRSGIFHRGGGVVRQMLCLGVYRVGAGSQPMYKQYIRVPLPSWGVTIFFALTTNYSKYSRHSGRRFFFINEHISRVLSLSYFPELLQNSAKESTKKKKKKKK